MKTYIAGPMTGIEHLNFPAFNAAAALYRSRGALVVNPAEMNGGEDELAVCAAMDAEQLAQHWQNCMRKDLAAIVTECDHLVMLPGWERSRGATLEHHVAKALGLTITYPEFTAERRPSLLLTEPQRRYLTALQDGRDPFAHCQDPADSKGAARTRNVLQRRKLLDACGRLTNAGREALK